MNFLCLVISVLFVNSMCLHSVNSTYAVCKAVWCLNSVCMLSYLGVINILAEKDFFKIGFRYWAFCFLCLVLFLQS